MSRFTKCLATIAFVVCLLCTVTNLADGRALHLEDGSGSVKPKEVVYKRFEDEFPHVKTMKGWSRAGTFGDFVDDGPTSPKTLHQDDDDGCREEKLGKTIANGDWVEKGTWGEIVDDGPTSPKTSHQDDNDGSREEEFGKIFANGLVIKTFPDKDHEGTANLLKRLVDAWNRDARQYADDIIDLDGTGKVWKVLPFRGDVKYYLGAYP